MQHPFPCLTYHLRSNLRLSDTQLHVDYDTYKLGTWTTARLGSFRVCALSEWLDHCRIFAGFVEKNKVDAESTRGTDPDAALRRRARAGRRLARRGEGPCTPRPRLPGAASLTRCCCPKPPLLPRYPSHRSHRIHLPELKGKPQILFADSLHLVATVVSVECMQLRTQMRQANAYVDLKRRRVSLCRSLNGSSTVAARASGDS